MNKLINRKLLASAGLLIASMATVPAAQAGPTGAPFSFFTDPGNGWTAMTLSTAGEDGQIGPGAGGQPFDAEYLFFKQSGSTLSIGLQAGFNLETGYVYHSASPNDYYAGDLALSFDGDNGTYEYGVDFGLLTKDYQLDLVDMAGGTSGIDSAGFYSVSSWNTDVYSGHSIASPFAIDGGAIAASLSDNSFGSGTVGGELSYWRTVSFDIGGLGLGNDLDAHWTMNCGNDFINGSTTLTSVPEPSVLGLMMMSLFGMGWANRRRKRVA